jgi:tellurite methyltransferase
MEVFVILEQMHESVSQYYEITKDLHPSELLVSALPLVGINNKEALDLGCGAGRDARYLLDHGFHVTAVDIAPEAAEYINKLEPSENIKFVNSGFIDFDYQQYDLVNARYTLPFNSAADIPQVINKIIGSLNPNGIFVGQLFGPNDEWNTPDHKMNFHTIDDVRRLFSTVEIIELTELEKEDNLADGTMKHWHVYDIIVRKP